MYSRANLGIDCTTEDRGVSLGGDRGSEHEEWMEMQEIPQDEVVISMTHLLRDLPVQSTMRCIYKVPPKLKRNENDDFYTPRVLIIGPLCRRCPGASYILQDQKMRYVQSFLNRTRMTLVNVVQFIRPCELEARSYYVMPLSYEYGTRSPDFVKMLVEDGCFIIEFLWRVHFRDKPIDSNDCVFGNPRFLDDVARDLILLENQIPFFVLERLFAAVYISTPRLNISLAELVHEFFKKYLVKVDKLPDAVKNRQINHFIDFLREYYVPSSPKEWGRGPRGDKDDETPPSATELYEAGVKFKKVTGTSLLDIEFSNGQLTIPQLEIDDDTETFFRNLIAFEQCHGTKKFIIHYALFMDSIINSTDDVKLLIKHGIIARKLGSNEDVAEMFNNICKNVVCGHEFFFYDLCKDLNAYCRIPRHEYMAVLKRDYFGTPWTIIGFVTAFIILVLTFIQAVCSVLSL